MGSNAEPFPVGHGGAGTGCHALVCPRTSRNPERRASVEEATMATRELLLLDSLLKSGGVHRVEGRMGIGTSRPRAPHLGVSGDS